jgi:SpoVK/Ycf46/Vps4 family AAA+-type ATPase
VESLKYQNTRTKDEALVSMLLHGMPGTGKTEFVHYLGHILKKEVILKRSSEIQSAWVGQTEKNIASSFAEGRESGGILFFDEADSFLFPRQNATHSWEKSHTNEILTQLENHRGIVVFSTNDIDGLDHAALRRFGFKIRFDPLTPEGNMLFYKNMLMPLMQDGNDLTTVQMEQLKAISNLTPGDFAVVRNQAVLLVSGPVSHEKLITDLENEVKYKKEEKRIKGFGA